MSEEFEGKYFVMFDTQECFRYKTRYKDAPGFMRCEKVGTALRFYGSVLNEHPGYSLEFSTGSGVDVYSHPLDVDCMTQVARTKIISHSTHTCSVFYCTVLAAFLES